MPTFEIGSYNRNVNPLFLVNAQNFGIWNHNGKIETCSFCIPFCYFHILNFPESVFVDYFEYCKHDFCDFVELFLLR